MSERVTWDLSTLQGNVDKIIINNNRITAKYDDEYLSTVNNICTIPELRSLLGITQGNNANNNDITWLKFRTFDDKELLIANMNIITSISYDHLQSVGVVKGLSTGYDLDSEGKIIDIGGVLYRVRLLTGAGANPSTVVGNGGEWNRFIVRFVPSNTISNWSGVYSWCIEYYSSANRVLRGSDSVGSFNRNPASHTTSNDGFRPVLERL